MAEGRGRTYVLGAILLALLWPAWGAWTHRELRRPPGVLAPQDPQQEPLEAPRSWERKGHRIEALARYEIRARILGLESYRFDRAAELSPLDAALGWGPCSDSAVLEDLNIGQGDRWYTWTASKLKVSPEAILVHSANTHLIPADPTVRRRFEDFRVGQVVVLRGYLVHARGSDGWNWISSLSRGDTGDGSCEVLWVEEARIEGPR